MNQPRPGEVPFPRWRAAAQTAAWQARNGFSSAPRRTVRPPTIVLGGCIVGLGVTRGLRAIDVPVVLVWHGKHEVGRVSSRADVRVEAPHPERAEEEYIDLLLGLAERAGGGLLVPCSDATVGVVARHKELLQRHYEVACVDWDIAERFLDKKRTYELASHLGVAFPRTLDFASLDEIEAATAELVFPCVVKPRKSHRYFESLGAKMALAKTYDELVRAWSEADELGMKVLIQEFIPGGDSLGVNYNAYVMEGRPVAECTAQKLRLSPPQIGFPRVVVSKEIPEVVEPGRRLLGGMGFHGFANIEFKLDQRDDTYKLMEVNGRHNNSVLLSVRSGVNFPAIMYRHLIEGKLPPSGVAQRTGVYWISMPSDPIQSIRHRRTERLSLREYLTPYLRPHVFDVLDRRDPRPFVAELGGRLRARLRGARRGAGKAQLPDGPGRAEVTDEPRPPQDRRLVAAGNAELAEGHRVR